MTGGAARVEQIREEDRANAAAMLVGDDAKTVKVREAILAGNCDEHPLVQGSAFYRKCA